MIRVRKLSSVRPVVWPLEHCIPTLMVSLNRPGFGYEVFWCHNTGRKYLVFLDFWYLDTSFKHFYKVYMIEICSELHHELAKEGMEKTCDRLQCTKMSTLNVGVVIPQCLTNSF